jgi:hypothetical protein
VIDLGTCEGANDKVEIRRCEPLPTIRTNHREPSISIGRAVGKLRQFVERASPAALRANTLLLTNGGAWQTGVPNTGNGATSDQKKATVVTIEEENLTIDLQQEFASRPEDGRARNDQSREKSPATVGAAFSRNRVQGASKNR